MYQIYKTLNHYFEEIVDQLSDLPDPRKAKQYGIDELVMSGISMFLFKQDSRNAYNNDRKDERFKENYRQLFCMELSHMDTVKDLFCSFDPTALEKVKKEMVTSLIRQKLFYHYRYQGCYLIAIDGTGVVNFDQPHCDCCLTKTSKNDKVTYFHNVLEAKLITASGFSISLASEWIVNENKTNFDKQDCERKAFKRLAEKIKAYYPRLPILILADGLYPYQGFFENCKENQWHYIVTLQDKTLKTLQEDIQWEGRINPQQQVDIVDQKNNHRIKTNYKWLRNLAYKDYKLNWVECNEIKTHCVTKEITTQRFVHITDLEMNSETCYKISNNGRLRQKIENEGFNDQKNHGYQLEHKFVRGNFKAMKNFYQCLQIAHIINQLVTISDTIKTLLKTDGKLTIKYLWKRLISFMLEGYLTDDELLSLIQKRFQIRLI